VDCTTAREALSARLDGELSPVMETALDEHLASCASCAASAGALADLARRSRLHVAPQVPDLSSAVVETVRARAEAVPWSPARVGLVVVGLAQLLLSLPTLLLGDAVAASLHVAREVGVTELALAVGMLAAAWRPWRAAGMLPVVGVLAVGLAVTSTVDVLQGEIGALEELVHLLPLAGAVLLWQVRHTDPLAPGPQRRQEPGPGLRRAS